MSDVLQQQVETRFSVVDVASGPMARIARQAGVLSSMMDNASRVVGNLAGMAGLIAGGFGIASAVRHMSAYFESVSNIATQTGLTTQKTAALRQMFELAGMSGRETEMTLLRMARKTAGLAGGAERAGAMYRRLGLNMKAGPEAVLMKMSDLVSKGKIGTGEVGRLLGMFPQQAGRMMEMLRKGSAQLKRDMFIPSSAQVTPETIGNYRRVVQAGREIRNAWEDIQIIVAIKLMPVLARLMTQFSRWVSESFDSVAHIAEIVGEHLAGAMRAAVALGKVLLANYLVLKSSAAMGVAGGAGVGIGGAAAAVGRKAIAGTAITKTFQTPMAWLAIMPVTFFNIGKFLLPIAARFSIILGVVALIAGGIYGLLANVSRVRDGIAYAWERIATALAPITLAFSVDGAIGRFFFMALPMLVEGLLTTVGNILQWIKEIAVFMAMVWDDPGKLVSRGWTGVWSDAVKEAAKMTNDDINARRAAAEAERAAAVAGGPATPKARENRNFDFRGSHFDIKQEFAEGFDPDQIAAAFSHGLANLADRRTQSGFSPLFGVR